MSPRLAVLADRVILEVRGAETAAFLQKLVTSDVETVEPGQARYAALLSPQGKIVSDFLAFRVADGFLLDAPAAVAPELLKRLRQYRLRARLDIDDRSETLGAVAFAPGEPVPADALAGSADPRHPGLWGRAILPRTSLPPPSPEADTLRLAARLRSGVPEGGVDFAFGDAFPHEANLDRLGGVDFRKGCYVGQEVVSRVHHRGTARRRVLPVSFEGAAPAPGTPLLAGGIEIGTMGSAVDGVGLASVRTDRVRDAEGPITAGKTLLDVTLPAWVEQGQTPPT